MQEYEPKVVELHFPIIGQQIPADHNYALFSAICRIKAEIHNADWMGIHSIKGTRDGRGYIYIAQEAQLKIRLPVQQIPLLYSLAGKKLIVDSCTIVLGIPTIVTLSPSPSLWSRLVIIKLAEIDSRGQAECFLQSAMNQLESLGIKGTLSLEKSPAALNTDGYARRVISIRGVTLAGYGVHVTNLSDIDSMHLQKVGIGGRRKMGCGIFVSTQTVPQLCATESLLSSTRKTSQCLLP